MPRTKYFCAITNRVIIGARLTSAPAIISGHLPDELALEERQPDRRRVLVEVAQVDERVSRSFQDHMKMKIASVASAGLRQRHVDVAIDLPRVGAVDAGGVRELDRDGQEELAEQEDPERAAEERPQPQRLLGADEVARVAERVGQRPPQDEVRARGRPGTG